jgi:hypothetical protein
MKPKPLSFNRNITANNLAKMLTGAGIKVLKVTHDAFDEVDDEIQLEKELSVQVGHNYVIFGYFCKDNGSLAMYNKEVKNLDELLEEIKKAPQGIKI